MAQSLPNLRTDTVLLDVSGAPPRSTAVAQAAAQAALIQSLVQQLRQSADDGVRDGRAFDWVTRKPSPIYYPPYATQSLDDTPEIYGHDQTRDVGLRRALQHYLETHRAGDITESPRYTSANIASHITQADLCLLDVFDVFQNDNFNFHIQRQRCSPPTTTTRERSSSAHSKPSSHGVADDPALCSYETVLHTLNDSVRQTMTRSLNPVNKYANLGL